MSEQQPVKFGILGVAGIAKIIAEGLQDAPSATLYGTASRSLEKAEAFANEYGGKGYGSYDALLEDEQIDAVYIPLPTGMCHEWTIKAANKGKHVLVDKPLPEASKLEEMIATCESNNVMLMDGTHFVHSTRIADVQEVIKSGKIGKVDKLNCCFSWLMPPKDIRHDTELEPYGALGDLGWYCIKLSLYVFGFDYKELKCRAEATKNGETGSISGVRATIYYDDKSVAFDSEFNGSCVRQWGEIVGSKGNVFISDFVLPTKGSTVWVPKEELKPEMQYFVTSFPNAEEFDHKTSSQVPVNATNRLGVSQVSLMFEDFVEAMKDAEKAKKWMNEALVTQKVLDAVYKATLS